MKLSVWEQEILDASGNASELMLRFFNKEIKKNNAEKQLAGIRTLLRYKSEIDLNLSEGELREFELLADGTIKETRLIRIADAEDKTPEFLMKAHGYDVIQWDFVKAGQSIWNMPQKDSDPRELYSSRIEVKPKQTILSEELIKTVFAELEIPKIKPVEYTGGDVLVEPCILDLHLGKGLSLDEEVALFKYTVRAMIGKLQAYNIQPERVLLQIGQDFLHIDGANKTTTAGTQMDVTASWSDIYRTALDLYIWQIEMFRAIAPVDCFYVPGNHDKTLSFCLALALERIYTDCGAVTVDTVDFPRKYYKYGVNAIGMSHGREEGKRIQHSMQQEAPIIWADTKYREFHLGDLHHEKSEEIGGVIYRRTSALTELDQWHIDKAYRAIRKAPLYVWDKAGGKDTLEVLVKV